jgi:hypothetical protein
MNLKDILHQTKPAILKSWFKYIVETYPSDSNVFLKNNKDRFANPVGSTIENGIEVLFDQLLGKADPDRFSEALSSIVKIRAVQDFTASQALDFILLLKRIVREEIAGKFPDGVPEPELAEFESEIDGLLLRAFDIYMECYKTLCDIKTSEVKNSVHMLLRRANMVV